MKVPDDPFPVFGRVSALTPAMRVSLTRLLTAVSLSPIFKFFSTYIISMAAQDEPPRSVRHGTTG